MIIDELDQLEGRLRNVEALQASEQTQNVWRHHAREFEGLMSQIHPPLSFLAWLRSKTGDVSMPDSGRALQSLRRLRDALEADPSALLREGALLDEARSAARECVNALSDAAKSAWLAYGRSLPVRDADLYAPFEEQERYRALVRQARAEDEKLTRLMNVPYLATGAERAALESLLEARLATREQLPSVEDVEIREFVTKASQTGVPVAALTPKVWEWLKANELEASYVVRKRPTGGGRV